MIFMVQIALGGRCLYEENSLGLIEEILVEWSKANVDFLPFCMIYYVN